MDWIKRFIYFHGKRHPNEMSEKEIAQFISYLASTLNVAASTENQALNALVFLYEKVLRTDLGDFGQMERAKRPKKIPVVLTKEEVEQVLGAMFGTTGMIAKLIYGSGLRLMECFRLRVNDIEFSMNQLIVRNVKGHKDRVTILPEMLKPLLKDHLGKVKIHSFLESLATEPHRGQTKAYSQLAIDNSFFSMQIG